jgi:head-tail adaptor
MPLPFTTDTVTVVHAELISDSYNNRVRDWPNASRTAVRAVVDSTSSTETTDGQDQTDTTYRCYLPPGTAVTAQDRLEWEGRVLEVTGEPTPRKGPTGALDHVQVDGRLISG